MRRISAHRGQMGSVEWMCERAGRRWEREVEVWALAAERKVAAEDSRGPEGLGDSWENASQSCCYHGCSAGTERCRSGEGHRLLRRVGNTSFKDAAEQTQAFFLFFFYVDPLVIRIQSPRLASVPTPTALCGSDGPSEPINCEDVTKQHQEVVSGPRLCVADATLTSLVFRPQLLSHVNASNSPLWSNERAAT